MASAGGRPAASGRCFGFVLCIAELWKHCCRLLNAEALDVGVDSQEKQSPETLNAVT